MNMPIWKVYEFFQPFSVPYGFGFDTPERFENLCKTDPQAAKEKIKMKNLEWASRDS